MSQTITITIDGKDGVVSPDIALRILDLVFQTLESIDKNTWAVGSCWLRWRVAAASVKNPFALTYDGESLRDDYSAPPDVVRLFIAGCEEIEQGKSPAFFATDDVKRMSEVGRAAKRLRSLEFRNTQHAHTVAASLLADNAIDLLANPDRVYSNGSIEGILGSLQNYPDRPGAFATLVTRIKEDKVVCSLTPVQAEELNDYVDRKTRVVLYGRIAYENGVPHSMTTASYKIIPPDEDLPTLDDVRSMKLTVPDGQSIEDFISEMRGDD